MSSEPDVEQQARFESIVVLDISGSRDTAFTCKEAAIKWLRRWIATLDTSLQQNLHLKTLYLEKSGWSLKVRFKRLQEPAFDRAIDAFTRLTGAKDFVHIMSDEDVAAELVQNEVYKHKMSKKASDCGDYARTEGVVSHLSQYIGPVGRQGPTKKQKRSALAGTELLNRAHRIGSASLREARVEDEDEEEAGH